MNDNKKMVGIAGKVLELAGDYDSRLEVFPGRIKAWARAFALAGKVWEKEALEAVDAFYASSRFTITAADVVAYCEAQPVSSSEDHVNWALDMWIEYPYAMWIEEHTGERPPEVTVPDSVPAEERDAFIVAQHRTWLNENRDRLVALTIERSKHKVRPVFE
ncbi:hypothetical protein [Nocardia wallacei]|uniref:hypothetical protein n=1 Tax=Nocardia wallacei TaxID=480035 RepID=UPI002453BF9F|nr:hypothetical protein [Nocardia wallacei]